ncbi:MAG: hypothetical protein LUQ38_09570 [Methanotrichaceae archaeon]|nr:hypothetical protein [Methanotrichaceae archaeon]
MDEFEALIRRRELLMDRISKMEYEVDKIDRHLAFISRMPWPDLLQIHDNLSQEI